VRTDTDLGGYFSEASASPFKVLLDDPQRADPTAP
jgi:hypothetical protein